LAFGANGEIDLSGLDGSAGGTDGNFRAGTGAGGCPGCLLVLVDGDFGLPDLNSTFVANRGQTNVVGNSANNYSSFYIYGWPATPYTGINEGYTSGAPVRILDGGDLASACSRVQYIPD
jgi:hypothetical protein